MTNPDRVEEVPEAEKRIHTRALGFVFDGLDESERREFVDHLWSDPDRRHEFFERRRANFETSPIHQEIEPGVQAALTEWLGEGKISSEEQALGTAVPKLEALLEDAGVGDEIEEAAARADFEAFYDCVGDYFREG